MGQVDAIYHMTLLPQAASWWSGANIPGKPRQFLYFLGGFAAYRELCESWLAGGFDGYRWDGAAPAHHWTASPEGSSEESLADLHVAAI